MKKILVAVAALVAAAFVISSLLKPTAKVTAAWKGKAVQAVPGSVTVQAEYQMELKSEIAGRVIRSELDPGKPVKAGSVLVQIDTGDLELEIEHIQSEYDAKKKSIAVGSSIKLALETATANLQNFERLTKAGTYSVSDLETRRREVKQIEQSLALEAVANDQQIAAFENTLKVKRRQLDKMTITAPFDGIVSAVYARPGDLIGGATPIATLIATHRTIEAKISEENFANIKLNQIATVRFLGYGDGLYDAKVVKILPTADPETQRYIVHLEVKIDPDKLVPGLTGEVNITTGERMSDTLIPRRALFDNNVYVVEDGRVRLRKVEVGYVSLNIAEVTKGLKTGDLVIVEELEKFRDGNRVSTELVK
jgi:RND family efflux transporter MFP subunit